MSWKVHWQGYCSFVQIEMILALVIHVWERGLLLRENSYYVPLI